MSETQKPQSEAAREAESTAPDDVHLIYKIDGKPDEVDVFELSRVLDSLGTVLKESNRIAYPGNGGEMELKVKPFVPGSFVMDIALRIKESPGVLFFLSRPEVIEQVKGVLEKVGLVKKAYEAGESLIDLLRKLREGKPEKVEQKGGTFEYHAKDGSIIPVDSTIHNLYNSPTVNNFIFNIAAPVERPEVIDVSTYLKNAEELTGVKIGKEDVKAIRAYTEPPSLVAKIEIIDNFTEEMLHPKAGNYGETTGQWTFRIAGSKNQIKAKIRDEKFLSQYTNGSIRFYTADLLRVRLHAKKTVEGTKVRIDNEIIEVLEYRPAHPSQRTS